MVDHSSDRSASRFEPEAWQRDNERGLTLAADGDWAEATEAFAAAADCLARVSPSEMRSVHEPLALVLSNLAQACYRVGRLDDAVRQAQRVCALRVAIAGEDGMPVARARMDLAVMLASAGRLDEATALVQRAITGIEHRVGEEDARLAVVLENAARIALAAGHPANAEPLLLRLHALLDAHDLSTARAEVLLARVAEARSRHAAAPQVPAMAIAAAPDAAPVILTPPFVAAFDEDSASRVYAHATIAEQEEWDDLPLRDAVALTDVLLRTTPSGVPIIPAATVVEPPSLERNADNAHVADLMLDTMDFSDILPAPALREGTAEGLLSLELTDAAAVTPETPAIRGTAEPSNASADRVPTRDTAHELDFAFDDLMPTATGDLSSGMAMDVASSENATAPTVDPDGARVADDARVAPTGPLRDFVVEHGIASEEEPLLQRPPISSPIPDPLPPAPVEPPAGSIPAVSEIADGTVPLRGEISTRPLRHVRASDDAERVVLPAPTPTAGKGRVIAAIAGAATVIGGAAAFFLLR